MKLKIPVTVKTTKTVHGCDACGKQIIDNMVTVTVKKKYRLAVGAWKNSPRTAWQTKLKYCFHMSCIKLPMIMKEE